jgi:hypothetical protein
MNRIHKAATAAFLALALAIPAYSHHVPVPSSASDSETFATYLSEQTAQGDGVVSKFMAYRYAKAAEKSDLGKDAQTALLVTIEHMDSLEVRECFAPFAELVDEFYGTLVRYFEVVGPNPALAEALFAYAGSLYTALTASIVETVAACAPTEDTASKLDELAEAIQENAA